MNSPFGGPKKAKGDKSSTPQSLKICCPRCSSEEFDAKQNQWEMWRECRVCGNRWSGGSAGAGQPEITPELQAALLPNKGVPAPDDLDTGSQYTGADFRDPSKNFDY